MMQMLKYLLFDALQIDWYRECSWRTQGCFARGNQEDTGTLYSI